MTKYAEIRPFMEDYVEYLRDESRTEGYADSISFPTNEQEICSILKALYPSRTPVTIQGARTGLTAGAVPFGGHILNTWRMNHILGMRQDEDGLFHITLQPGVVLSELQRVLAEKDFPERDTDHWDADSLATLEVFRNTSEQFFPTNPTESTAFVGGIVACNSSGSRSFMYGSARGYVTALRIVLCDGSVISLKRGEVFAKGRSLSLTTEDGKEMHLQLPSYRMPNSKNTSGYFIQDDMDAIDLFIGSDGTLGVISQVELKLLPRPSYIWAINSFFDDEAAAMNYVKEVRKNRKGVAALEYFDGDALNILRTQKAKSTAFSTIPDINPDKHACIYTEIHSNSEDEIMELLEGISVCLEECGAGEADTWFADTPALVENLRFFRHAIPECTNMMIDERRRTEHSITKLGSDMSVPDDKLDEVLALYRRTIQELGLESAVWGHVGENHLHVNIIPRNLEEYKIGKKLFADCWAAEISKMGGAVSAEHGVGKIKSGFLETMYGPEHIREMAAMKACFDPDCVFGKDNMFCWEKFSA